MHDDLGGGGAATKKGCQSQIISSNKLFVLKQHVYKITLFRQNMSGSAQGVGTEISHVFFFFLNKNNMNIYCPKISGKNCLFM